MPNETTQLLRELNRLICFQQMRLDEGARTRVPLTDSDEVRELYTLFLALTKETQEGFNSLAREVELMIKSNGKAKVKPIELYSEPPRSPQEEEEPNLVKLDRLIASYTNQS